MSDDTPVDDGQVAGLNLDHMREQQTRLKLGIPLYDNEQDKAAGKMHELSEAEREKYDKQLGLYRRTDEPASGIEVVDEEARLTPEAVSEKIQEHRIHMQDALDDVRGRIGVGGEGLAPEPGTAEAGRILVPILEHIQREMATLIRDGRTKDVAYANINQAYASVLAYLEHSKAAVGLSAYMKRNFAGYLAEQEKAAKETEQQKSATEKARSLYGKAR